MKEEFTYCIKAKKHEAEKLRKELYKKKQIDHSFVPKSVGKFVFFPVKEEITGAVRAKLKRRQVKPRSLKEALEQMGIESYGITKSFDIVGEVAIVDVPANLKRYERTIAKAVMEVHPNIKTVAKKMGPVSGIYRIRKLRTIAGKRKTETIHTESECRFKLDVAKAYFSPRLVFERQRITNLIRKGETIFVPFAGVGPFAIIIAKSHPDANVYANELNPAAFKYLKENIRLNRTFNVLPIPGDARKVARKFKGIADRVLMPIPMSSDKFLDVAFALAKKGGIVHFYYFTKSEEDAIGVVKRFAKRKKRTVKILFSRLVREYSPNIAEYVIDFRIL